MAAEKFEMQNFISLQPFWNMLIQNSMILRDENEKVVARLCDMVCGAEELTCVPGIGLMSIIFSKDPQHPSAYCCGTLDKGKAVPLYGVKDTFFCQFMPGEFTRAFGIPGSELTNLEIPLEDLIHAETLAEEIANAKSFQDRVQIFVQFLRSAQPAYNPDTPQLVYYLVKTVLRCHGDIRIRELEEQTGYSARYLQEVMQSHVGLSPKRICNNVRFQGVLHQINRSRQVSLTDITQQFGFYDQSHFTKVFKEYVGMSPSAFLKDYNKENR